MLNIYFLFKYSTSADRKLMKSSFVKHACVEHVTYCIHVC